MQQQMGYTLIELVVVLILFSLLTALVAPRLTTLYDSIQTNYEKNDVIARLSSLSYLAFQQGQTYKLSQYPPPLLPKETKETQRDVPKLNIPSLIKKEKDKNQQFSELPEIPLELPSHWELKTETPILFHANGVCEGGKAHVLFQQIVLFDVQFTPPFCKVVQNDVNE